MTRPRKLQVSWAPLLEIPWGDPTELLCAQGNRSSNISPVAEEPQAAVLRGTLLVGIQGKRAQRQELTLCSFLCSGTVVGTARHLARVLVLQTLLSACILAVYVQHVSVVD